MKREEGRKKGDFQNDLKRKEIVTIVKRRIIFPLYQ